MTTNTFATGFGFAGLLPATSKDRPIGMTLRLSQQEGTAAKPGGNTIRVPLVDGAAPNLQGSYILYLRVERVP